MKIIFLKKACAKDLYKIWTKIDCADQCDALLTFIHVHIIIHFKNIPFQIVAIKTTKLKKCFINRELSFMLALDHFNVIKLLYFFYRSNKFN